MSHQLTANIDTAQVVLYLFWVFFFGLIVWLRREDRREGYPLETDSPMQVSLRTDIRIPAPKSFLLPHDEGIRRAPDFVRDEREIKAVRLAKSAGSPSEPTGDPLLSAVGPASYAKRSDHPELCHEDGGPAIIPMRVAKGFSVDAGPDPRGWRVIGADGEVAGKVTDIWVDRADLCVRYLELELAKAGDGETSARLLPIQMLGLDERRQSVSVRALRADQFVHVPTTKDRDQVTVYEEERVSAFYAGGWFYAEPKRREPLV